MALGQMLAPMFETVDASKGAFGEGSGEQAWQLMMVTEIGKQMAKSGGVGLARPVMEQMLRLTGMRSPEQKPPSAPTAHTAAAAEVATAEAPVAPAETASPGNSRKHRQAAQKAATIQKRGKSKHRRSK